MAQVSYGTITITDTTDIESIVVEYSKNQSTTTAPETGWSTNRPSWQQGYYIWQRTRTHKAGTADSTDTYGTPVCITGSAGATGDAGRSLTNTVTQYTTATSSATITQDNMNNYNWTNNVPSYSSSTPAYWVRVTNTYSNPSSTQYIIYKDNGITDAIAAAASAESLASQASQDASAASQAVALLGGHFIYKGSSSGQSTSSGAGIIQNAVDSPSGWGYNTWIGSNGIQLRTGETVLSQWTSSGINFYNSSGTITSTFGNSISLASNGASITIGATGNGKYNTFIDNNGLYLRTGTTSYATLNANGLVLSKGGIQAGTAGQSNFIYLNTENYSLRQFIDSPDTTINLNKTYYALDTTIHRLLPVESPILDDIDTYYEVSSSATGLTINGYTPAANSIISGGIDDPGWRQIIGINFGVTADGTLYASNANIQGVITISEGSNVYSQEETDSQLYGTYVYQYSHIVDSQEVIEDVYLKDDGTYYYLNNGIEVPVSESLLMVDDGGNLVKIPKGGLSEVLNDVTDNIDSINNTLANTEDNSLYARGYASFSNDKLILYKKQNDNIKSALELTSDAVVLKVEGIEVASMRSSGTMGIMKATNMEQSYVKMINSSGTGLYQWIAQSDGHLSLKKL